MAEAPERIWVQPISALRHDGVTEFVARDRAWARAKGEYVLASTHTRAMEALREAREAVAAQIAAHYRLCRAAGLSDQDHLDGSAQARAALSRIDAILKEDTAHD